MDNIDVVKSAQEPFADDNFYFFGVHEPEKVFLICILTFIIAIFSVIQKIKF